MRRRAGVIAGIAWILGSSSCASKSALPPESSRASAVHARTAPIEVSLQVPANAIATRRDPVTDMYFGHRVEDPYRWLEDDASNDVRAWVAAQNELTRRTLAQIPGRAVLADRLEQLLQIGQISLPRVRRTRSGTCRYFYTRRQGKQNQPVLLARDGLRGADAVVFDPNAHNTLGTTALDWYAPSRDGSLVAYGTSEGGSEESTLHVIDVVRGRLLADEIPRTRAASVCFTPDNRRFFYSRYPRMGSVPSGEEKYHRRIFQHVIGSDPEHDTLVFGADRALTDYPSCDISPDGRWLVIRVDMGWSKSELYVADTRATKLSFVPLIRGEPHVYDSVVRNDTIYVLTNEAAPHYALYSANPHAPARKNWRAVLREHPTDVLESVEVIGSNILAKYVHETSARLERFDLAGKSLGALELPAFGASDGFSGLEDGDEAFFQFESFAIPPLIERLDLHSRATTVWEKVDSNLRADAYRVSFRKARSKDGTLVPYAIVHSPNTDLKSGNNPTFLYGYGGFNLSLEPRFSRTNYALFERGAIYVQANLRGGGEFGEDWHRAGQLHQKQNVFDDFIAVAEDLVRQNVTRPEKLAIFGRSNGGLLVAAALTQRPDLFSAAVSSVPLTDMLRYEQFLIGKLWRPEYGSVSERADFEALLRYSPYHHVRTGTAYPAVLFTTAASDTRVAPLHARKMTAALQHATSSGKPVLLRTEFLAGHGAGKPISKVADEYADIFAFALWQLGVLSSRNESE